MSAASIECMKSDQARVERLRAALSGESHRARCAALRELCPCRASVRDLEVWRSIFHRARAGGQRERDQAAHAIGTLTAKAQGSLEWASLLRALRGDLDSLMRDERAASAVLAQTKRSCNQRERRGTALRKLRRRRNALQLATPAELAAWVNQRFHLAGGQRLGPSHPGVLRLWRWMQHRVRFQPMRGTKEGELADRARRYLPEAAAGA